MADLSNPLTQVVVAQAQPAVTVNNVIDALSPAACFGQNDLTTIGLTWGYYGGRFNGVAIAHGTIALPASQATVYIVAHKTTGVVSQSTSITNWNNDTDYQRLYLATTGGSTITDWDDYREVISSSGAGGGGGGLSQENIEDIVASLITAGANITKQYNDGDSPATLVISSTGGGSSLTQEQIEDIVGSLVTAGSGINVTYNDSDSPATLSISATGGGSSLTQEQIEDIVASLITAGSGVTKQYNDGDSPATLVLSASGGGGTPAGSDTHVQYNDSGAFAGSAAFTWDDSARTLLVNNGTDATAAVFGTPTQTSANTAGAALTVRSATGLGAGAGGALSILSGSPGTTGTVSGAISIQSGAGAGGVASGGNITLLVGASTGAAGGGSVAITAGAAPSNTAGSVNISSGASTGSNGGSVNIVGGSGSNSAGQGGGISITTGNARNGGPLTITTGDAQQTGQDGGLLSISLGLGNGAGSAGTLRFFRGAAATRIGSWFAQTGSFNVGPTTSVPTVLFRVEGSTCVTATSQSASGTTTINLATTNVHKIAMGTNITTLTVSNPSDTQEVTIIFTQDGTGSRTIAWPAAFKWPGGTVPTLSTAAGAVDMYTGIYNSTTTSWLGRLEKAFA